jgi:excisionase family DNA binding protein
VVTSLSHQTPTEEEIMTTREAAAFLRISVLTLRKALQNRNLPVHKVGRKYFYIRSEILEWLKKQ